MHRYLAVVLLFLFVILAETLSFLAFKRLFNQQNKPLIIWWIVTILLYIGFFLTRKYSSNYVRNWYVNVFAIILVTKFFVGLFFVIIEMVRMSRNVIQKPTPEIDLSRREFSGKLALVLSAIPFVGLNYGIFKTAYDFKIHRKKIKLKNLPAAFEGFRIVQISDIHTGSLQSHHQLLKAIEVVHEQKPDLICFTGDLVNNRTDEVFPYVEDLQTLKAPYGILSILGNHDYGDYETWDSEDDKRENMRLMYAVHQKLGWNLLLNNNVSIEKDDEKLYFIGVENWGANLHFPKYGKLDKAYEGLQKHDNKILLSHDPSHFDTQVTESYKDIQLTLSGHTHGFQFGVEIPGYVKWSPSQYIYKHWAGLYHVGEQQLYVNRGLGCLGYMGRIGIRPEITVIELSKA